MTDHNRIRVEGGGRKKKEEKTPNIKIILKEIIDPSTYGDPNSELRWTSFCNHSGHLSLTRIPLSAYHHSLDLISGYEYSPQHKKY